MAWIEVIDESEATGDLDAAHDRYAASLAIREALAEADESDMLARRNLALAHMAMGRVQVLRRDLFAAFDSFETAKAMLRALFADPAAWRLVTSDEMLGEALPVRRVAVAGGASLAS